MDFPKQSVAAAKDKRFASHRGRNRSLWIKYSSMSLNAVLQDATTAVPPEAKHRSVHQPSHSMSSWFSRSDASSGIQWLAPSIRS